VPAGFFARRMCSTPLGIAFALVVGLILSYFAAMTPDPQGNHHYLEIIPSEWKARETYHLVSPDEFVETFEVALKGGAYEVYSKARFKRAQ
jgi:hypothetical protein